MEATLLAATPVAGRGLRLRASAVIAALALVLTMFVVVQQRAEAAPSPAPVAAALAVPAAAGVAAQIDIRQFVCPILIAVRNAFARSPFFSFVAAAINRLIVRFGCGVS